MAKIIQFPSKHIVQDPTKQGDKIKAVGVKKPRGAKREESQIEPAEDTLYFVTSLHDACNIAAYVYKDKVGVKMLLDEISRFYSQGISYDRLPLELRTHCRLYIGYEDTPQRNADFDKAFEYIYG